MPRVIYDILPIREEVELFHDFLFTDSGDRWMNVFNQTHPDLMKKLSGVKDKEKHEKICHDYLTELRLKKEKEMSEFCDQLQIEWDKIGEGFLTTLADRLQTSFPENIKEVKGFITLLPVFPRFLEKYSFCVGFKDVGGSIETSAHEIVHFLWFNKWSQVFPEMNSREYEAPNLVWRLSEIIDPVILHCEPKIKELIKPKGWGYTSFKNIIIDGQDVVSHFKQLYLQSFALGDSFVETMKKLWQEAQKIQDQIKTF